MNKKLETNIAGISLKNPITIASGTFGFGQEYAELIDLNSLGAISCKGLSLEPWKGNAVPRIAEVKSGILNSIGLQNPGVDTFIKTELPFLKNYDAKIIANICGHSIKEYCDLAARLSECDVDLLELNISCPNVDNGGLSFGNTPVTVAKTVSEVRKHTKHPLIVKLSPEVECIADIAIAAVDSGADALSLINTMKGMKIDIYNRNAILASKVGGYSGRGIMPIAVRMVYEVCKVVSVPVIGMGGIETYEDVLEFIMVGAGAVAIGTALFNNPTAPLEILHGLETFMEENNIVSLNDIRGIVK